MSSLNKDNLLDMYYDMVLIRRFEERSLELYHEKRIGGVYLHLYNGQEATGVGSVRALRDTDDVITAYRDHGIAIARGIDPKRVMAEMYGKRTGTSGGKGGSMHIADRNHHFWGGWAIVGGQLPIAAGIALKIQYNGEDGVVLCYVGDGATNNGYFHESVNLAGVWKLPVIWLIENNLYGMGTRVEDASGQTDLVKRAVAYGIKEGPRVDGQDVIKVYDATKEAAEYARKHGSVLMEALTYRYEGHGVSDKAYVNRKEELAHWEELDPIVKLRNTLCDKYKDVGSTLEKLEHQATDTVVEAVKFAEESQVPTAEDLVNHIYV